MSDAKFTSTRDNQGASSGTNKGHAFSHDDPPAPFGWQGEKKPRRASQMGPAKAQPSSLGNVDPGRLAGFEKGRREAFDAKARTAAVMVGAYAAGRGLQHWSAWKRQQGQR
jgi:hypothetical protein